MKFLLAILLVVSATFASFTSAHASQPVITSWSSELDSGLATDMIIEAAAHDSAGNEYVAAVVDDAPFNYSVIYKFNQYGDVQWTCPNFWDEVQINAISVDRNGTVYVTGGATITTPRFDMFLCVIDSAGQPVDMHDFPSPENVGIAGDRIGFDVNNNVTVACTNFLGNSLSDFDVVFVQYAYYGPFLGSKEIAGVSPGNEVNPQNFSFNSQGDCYFAGGCRTANGAVWDEADPTGTILQSHFAPNSTQGHTVSDVLLNVQVDGADNVYVTNGTETYVNNVPTTSEFVVHAFNSAMVQQWQSSTIDGWLQQVQPYTLGAVGVLAVTGPGSTAGAVYEFGDSGGNPLWSSTTANAQQVMVDAYNGLVVMSEVEVAGTYGLTLQKYLVSGVKDWSEEELVPQENVGNDFEWMTNSSVHLAASIDDRWLHLQMLNYTEGTAVSDLTFNTYTNAGGGTLTGTVTLDAPAPSAGFKVLLQSQDDSEIGVPSLIVVPAGETSATFTAVVTAVDISQPVTISAIGNGVRQQAAIQLNAGTLNALQLSASSVVGGKSLTGTVTISSIAGPGGRTVVLLSLNPAASAPASVFIPPGKASITFTITTIAVTTSTSSDIRATSNAVTVSAPITVTP